MVVEAEQQLNQLTRADHLGDEVERHYHQRTAGGKGANRPLFETIRGHVGKRVAAEVTQAFGDQEQNNRPADEETERVDQPVVAGGVNQCGNTEKRGRRHKVAGNRQTVLKTGNVAASGVVVAA